MECWDRLCPDGYRFIYDDTLFPPGTDTFVLSAFPRLKPGMRVCDLCSGTGLLGLLLLQRRPELTVTGVELLPEAAVLGNRTAAANGLEDRLAVRVGDIRQIRELLPPTAFDLVVCNPPYYPAGSGHLPESEARRAARAETTCTLEDVCAAASYLLPWGGRFCLVHKPERLADLCCALRGAGLELKRLRPVCSRAGAAPSLLLAEGRRGGRPGVEILPPLVLQNQDGTPTAELDAIYFRTQEESAP